MGTSLPTCPGSTSFWVSWWLWQPRVTTTTCRSARRRMASSLTRSSATDTTSVLTARCLSTSALTVSCLTRPAQPSLSAASPLLLTAQGGRTFSPPSPARDVPELMATSPTQTTPSVTSSFTALMAQRTRRPVPAASCSTPAKVCVITQTRQTGPAAPPVPCTSSPALRVLPTSTRGTPTPTGATSSTSASQDVPADSPAAPASSSAPSVWRARARRRWRDRAAGSTTRPTWTLSPALSANRVASQERRRPVRPLVNRQPQPQPPPEQIPQQLLDLQNFGQSQPGPSAPVRGRVPATRLRQEEKESFFNNLRGSISSRDRDQAPARPFTRPPLRRPAIELQEDTPRFEAAQAPATNSGFGRRRQPFRQRTETGTNQLSWLERTYVHHGTCYRMRLDQIGEFHHLGHEGYRRQHDRFPMTQLMFDGRHACEQRRVVGCSSQCWNAQSGRCRSL